jgi:hypothetical protein
VIRPCSKRGGQPGYQVLHTDTGADQQRRIAASDNTKSSASKRLAYRMVPAQASHMVVKSPAKVAAPDHDKSSRNAAASSATTSA